MSKVLFVHEPTMGMDCDAKVLGAALQRLDPSIKLYSLQIPWNENLDYSAPATIPEDIIAAAPFDIAFHFEHLYGHAPLRSTCFSKKRVFVPNIEWVYRQDELEIVNHTPAGILYKSDFVSGAANKIDGIEKINIRVTTGWTSQDHFPICSPRQKKDFRSFLHIRGRSNQKQTGVLLQAWLSRPDFPLLTIITSPSDDFYVPVKMRAASNIDIIYRTLSDSELNLYQRTCGIHVYPSLMEGFGHSLNEARACRAVLVTTDGLPMRDLVIAGQTGFLIPVSADEIKQWRWTKSYSVSAASITETIEKVLATPINSLREMGLRARSYYESDQHLFEKSIAATFGMNSSMNLGPEGAVSTDLEHRV